MSVSRPMRAVLAASLLLLHVLLPALHGWQHALEAAAKRAPCAECGHVPEAGRAEVHRGAPILEHQHAPSDDCALCIAIQLGRNVLLPGVDAAVPSPSPPTRLEMPTTGARIESDACLRPPARAPPPLLS